VESEHWCMLKINDQYFLQDLSMYQQQVMIMMMYVFIDPYCLIDNYTDKSISSYYGSRAKYSVL